MKKVLAIKSGNPTKAYSFKKAAEKIFPTDDHIGVPFSNELDVRPLTIEQIRNAVEENARRLASKMRGYHENSFAIAIQKGTNLAGTGEETPALFCAVTVQSIDTNIEFTVWSDEVVHLPQQMKILVAGGMEIYNAYKEVYSDDWLDGKASPYELQTGKSEVDWIRKTIEKALLTLKELLEKK